jgi:hypothetical protein
VNELDRLRYDVLSRQLGRMRAMQYAYHRKFFALQLLSLAAIAAAFLWPSAAAMTLLAFGLVTAGVTASFFLHFCDFARTHAKALEEKLNLLLGEPLLNAAELEADFFYPHLTRRLSGFTPSRPDTFFSFFTFHFSVVWVAAALLALRSLASHCSTGGFLLLLLVYGAWAAVNLRFLVRWFGGEAERRMTATLRERLGLDRPA